MYCYNNSHKISPKMCLVALTAAVCAACSSPESDPLLSAKTTVTETTTEETSIFSVAPSEMPKGKDDTYVEETAPLPPFLTGAMSERIEKIEHFADELSEQAPIYSAYLKKTISFPVCLEKSQYDSSVDDYVVSAVFTISPVTGLSVQNRRGQICEQRIITATDIFDVYDFEKTIVHTSLSENEATPYAEDYLIEYLPFIFENGYMVEMGERTLYDVTYHAEIISDRSTRLEALYDETGEIVYLMINGWANKIKFLPVSYDAFLPPDGYVLHSGNR